MKNEILDTPFRDSFQDFLKKEETILWQYNPNPTQKINLGVFKGKRIEFNSRDFFYRMFSILLIVLYVFIILEVELLYRFIIGFVVLLIGLIGNIYDLISKSSETEYAITQNRILFRLSHVSKNKIHQIHFSEIKNCILTSDKNNMSTIFLAVKNPSAIPFDTYPVLENQPYEKRHQPTLENIENGEAVAQLIRQGIKNVNTML